MSTADAVRDAFASQAGWCEKLGSPFTGRLCETVGRNLDTSNAVGRRILDWPGNPDALHDSVPLRLCGALHALSRSGAAAGLAALYPPNPLPSAETLWADLQGAFVAHEATLLPWLDLAPQTNEVARSAVLMAGLAVVATETGLPLALRELGASAGLNLRLDRYRNELGSRVLGDPASEVRLKPEWDGPDVPDAVIRVVSRRGIDLNPLDVTDERHRERLLAFVWADQAERLARLQAALAAAERDPPALDRGDAADWLEAELEQTAEPGIARVVMHSIAFQYFPAATQERIGAAMTRAGEAAEAETPLAWVSYEIEPESGSAVLRLRTWPDGRNRALARADPHGRRVSWLAG